MKDGKTTLFFVPYAGGSVTVYRTWAELLSQRVDVRLLELAGRGTRFGEPLYSSLSEAVADLCTRALPFAQGRYAFFGHSMGALLSYELALEVARACGRPPVHLFLSGRFPPHIGARVPINAATDENFLRSIAAVGGTPTEVFQNEDLMKLFLPILRSDYRITEAHVRPAVGQPLDCGISFFYAKDDPMLTRETVETWRNYTTREFRLLEFDGGHFFVQAKKRELIHLINGVLDPPPESVGAVG